MQNNIFISLQKDNFFKMKESVVAFFFFMEKFGFGDRNEPNALEKSLMS